MKVGIVTWFHYCNYGTALQVTALSRQLKIMGIDSSVINYIPSGKYDTIPMMSIGSEYKRKLLDKVKRTFAREKKYQLQEDLFNQFYGEHLKFTEKCDSLSDLEALNKKFDFFVCGSDQVWSPLCFDPHYYLDFVKENSKKVAYAPSLGVMKIEDKYIEQRIKELTSSFSYLSTREQSGSDIISNLVHKPVETVLDPTLLLDGSEWENVCKDYVGSDESYVLAYFLGNNEQYWNEVYKIAGKLGMKVKIIPMYEKDFTRNGCIENGVGPKEFLGLIKNAEYVCTDSFHGTIFAINFHKKFCTFERFKNTDKKNQNSRIHHILNVLELKEHLYGNVGIMNDIDYQAVEEKLEILRKSSKEYLASALEKESEYSYKKKHIYQANSLCCGCSSCASVCPKNAITISRNRDGFFEAIVDEEKCISCGRCQKVCPFQTKVSDKSVEDGDIYSYKDSQLDVLHKSSSGGIAYRISKIYLEKGYSIVGCMFDVDRQEARHIIIDPEKRDFLHLLQGSKYMQSDFSNVISEIRKRENPIVVIGTPCQIAGVKKVLANRNDIVYVDLICHGVPSYLVYEKYQKFLEKIYNMNIEKMIPEFRYKLKGWTEKYICVSDSVHTVCNHQDEDCYMRLFEQCNAYAKTCYECRWRTVSDADIRIGDYWGEKFQDDKTGVSMVIALTEVGREIVSRLDEMGVGSIYKEEILDYKKGQQTKNNPRPVYYEELLLDLKQDKIELDEIVEKYVKPFEERKRMRQRINKIKRIIK